LHDLIENQFDFDDATRDDLQFMEELNLNVSTENFLSAERAFTYADLYAMLGNEDTVAWSTPHAAAARSGGRLVYAWQHLGGACRFCFSVDNKYIVASALFSEDLLEICDVVLRLLAVSVVQSVRLTDPSTPGLFINAPTLANLMEQCQSLKSLSLQNLEMDEDHCRVFGGYSRPGLEIVLDRCKITSAGASALAEVLERNQGPTKLTFCDVDNVVLANGLRGNSRLQSLRPLFSGNRDVRNRQVLAIAGAVKENKGLVDLDLNAGSGVNDETWGAICDSLKTHPTLEVLKLPPTVTDTTTAPTVFKSRIQAILEMVKVNTSIHTIHHLFHRYNEHELYRESVIPYLETNRLRPRLLAIQKTRPILYRTKILGRALLAVRTDPNRFWMLLSGNAEVAFPSTTANFSTPATAAATPNTAAVAAAVTSTGAASTTGASTGANATTPTA
jgi:hypothetical protein